MIRRIALIGALVLLALLSQATSPSVSAPMHQAVTRPAVEIMLSAAPASGGTLIEIDVPAELLSGGSVPVIDRPGAENRIRP